MEVREVTKAVESEDLQPDLPTPAGPTLDFSEPMLEVDDEESNDSQDDMRSTYPTVAGHHRISTPFDAETFK